MAYILDGRENLSNGDVYIFYKKHRLPGNPSASLWQIPYPEELSLADNSITNNFYDPKDPNKTFNFSRKDNRLQIIGKSPLNEDLVLGQFKKSKTGKEWHGYPCDHRAGNRDKPHTMLLEKMRDCQLITDREMRLIQQGKNL